MVQAKWRAGEAYGIASKYAVSDTQAWESISKEVHSVSQS
jgi:hypothetical protein